MGPVTDNPKRVTRPKVSKSTSANEAENQGLFDYEDIGLRETKRRRLGDLFLFLFLSFFLSFSFSFSPFSPFSPGRPRHPPTPAGFPVTVSHVLSRFGDLQQRFG